MPALLPVYHQLVELAGGGDVESRFLSLYNPPRYIFACTQLGWTRGEIALVRNYDYHPKLCEGVFLYTNWLRPVIGMSDCCWGLLDGMNDAGLAVSLTFGGRKIVGPGFGSPLVLRYICETCTTTEEACAALARIPVHMAYNVTIIDAAGALSTVFLCPGKPALVTTSTISTNHQQEIEWEDFARMSATMERYECLQKILGDATLTLPRVIRKFQDAPIFNSCYSRGFGTLYTSIYHTVQLEAKLLWPNKSMRQSFDCFTEDTITVKLNGGKGSSLAK